MSSTTDWETASHCPKCSQPGNEVYTERIRSGRMRGGESHVLKCENERCKWFNTSWVVAVGPNGEIPIRKSGPKEYEDLTPFMEAVARRQIEELAMNDPGARKDVNRFFKDLEGQ